MKVLLTGAPGVGKSTVMTKFLDNYRGTYSGIVVAEVRNRARQRVGFEAVNPMGNARMIAHKAMFRDSRYYVEGSSGRYFVDREAIEGFVVPQLERAIRSQPGLIVIDEIGRMQSCSPAFINLVRAVLASDRTVLASIVHSDESWAREFKRHPDVCLLEVTPENRSSMPDRLLRLYWARAERRS